MTESNDLSFLPEDYAQRKIRRRSIAAGVGLTLGLTIALAAMVYVSRQSLGHVELLHGQVSRACAEASRQVERVRRDRDEQRRILQHAALAASLVEKVPRSNILAELTNTLPAGASLLSLNLESHPRQQAAPVYATAFDMKRASAETRRKAEIDGAADAGAMVATIRISGLAATDVEIAGYLNQLSRSPFFQDVHLLISEMDSSSRAPGAPSRRFQMEMTVNPNFPGRPAHAPPVMADGGQ